MRENIILTGRPGIGKTTVIKRVINEFEQGRMGGFWSSEIRERNARVGFSITTLNGDIGILAHINLDRGPRMGRYRVNIDDIDGIAVPALVRAREDRKIIVIDEIASMELFSKQFAPEVRRCLNSGRVLATLQQRRGLFQDEVRQREDVHIIEVTLSNREQLHKEILALL